MSAFGRFLKDESGATAIEYALIAALIGIALITALGGLSNAIKTKLNSIATSLNTAGT